MLMLAVENIKRKHLYLEEKRANISETHMADIKLQIKISEDIVDQLEKTLNQI
jgi:hypothetical protein